MIPENANQAFFTSGMEYKTGEFLTLHQPTSVHKNLFVVCLGFSEMASKLEIKLDFLIKVAGDDENNEDSNVITNDANSDSGSGTADPNPDSGSGTADPNLGSESGSVESPPPVIEEPVTTANETAKEEITPKTTEEVGSLEQEEETKFIQSVISYFEENEKENVIVIEQGEGGTGGQSGTTDGGQVGTIVDAPDGKGKEIVTVQTVKAKISKIYEN